MTRTGVYEWNDSSKAFECYQGVKSMFSPDETNYIVNKPVRTITVDANCALVTESGLLGETINTYDGIGQLTSQRSLLNSTGYGEAQYGYDSYGNVTSVTTYSGYRTAVGDPIGEEGARTTLTSYDSTYFTYPVTETDPLGHSVSMTYDFSRGVPVSVEDANHNVTTAEYDGFGRMVAIYAPGDVGGAATLNIEYYNYSAGIPFSIYLAQRMDSTHLMQYERFYSGLGELIQSQTYGAELDEGVKNVVADTKFDKLGRAVWQTVPYTYSGVVSYRAPTFSQPYTLTEYDTYGRVIRVTEPNGNQTQTSYDINREVDSTSWRLYVSQTDPKNNTTSTVYDTRGRVVKVIPPTGPKMEYAYDTLSRLINVTKGEDPYQSETHVNYDYAGRKTSMSDPDMGNWSYVYDALGNLISQTDARFQTTTLTYDALNRVLEKTSGTGGDCGTAGKTCYFYDGSSFSFLGQNYTDSNNTIGQRTGMLDASGVTMWTYDERGRKLTETKRIFSTDISHTENLTTSWTYNSADLPITMSYPDGEVVNLGYNDQGTLDSMVNSDSAPFTYVKSALYDPSGRLAVLGLGSNGTSAILTRNYDYADWNISDIGGRLIGLKTSNSLQNLAYNYDKNGNITSIIDGRTNGETSSFMYDALNRIISMTVTAGTSTVHSETFDYDDAGRLSQKGLNDQSFNLIYPSSTAQPMHAVVGYDGNSYVYDANGNQTERTINGLTFDLTYDAENHLSQVAPRQLLDAPASTTVPLSEGILNPTVIEVSPAETLAATLSPEPETPVSTAPYPEPITAESTTPTPEPLPTNTASEQGAVAGKVAAMLIHPQEVGTPTLTEAVVETETPSLTVTVETPAPTETTGTSPTEATATPATETPTETPVITETPVPMFTETIIPTDIETTTPTAEFPSLPTVHDFTIDSGDVLTVLGGELSTTEKVVGEVGQISNITDHPVFVTFAHSYTNPVVFVLPISFNGSAQAVPRVTYVQSNGFAMYIKEASNQDGVHVAETISYLVLEAGSWVLPNGKHLEVGTVSTNATVGTRVTNVWQTVNFTDGFSAEPVVLTQVQSANENTFVTTRYNTGSGTSFQFAMEEEEVSTTAHATETVGWMAIDAGVDTWNGHSYRALRTAASYDSSWKTLSFGATYASARFVGIVGGYAGANNANLRYKSLTDTNVQVLMQEDTTYDSETSHGVERINFLVFAGSSLLTAQISSDVTITPTTTPEPTAILTEPTPEPLQSAQYIYDGDGNMVKSLVNETVTYYVGKLYQKQIVDGVVTEQKYYQAAGQTLAVRTIVGSTDTLKWIFNRPLGLNQHYSK